MEAAGILLFAFGLLLFLSLISYDPGDVPSWVFFSHVSPANEVPQNFIGRVGAIAAGLSFFLLGGTALLLAVALCAFGVCMLFAGSFPVLERLAWLAVLIISAASLLQIQPWFLHDWKETYLIEGPGGWIGYWVGGKAFASAFNFLGASIVLGAIWLVSVIFVTGFRPIRVLRSTVEHIRQSIEAWRQRRLERLSEEERIKEEQRRLDREIAKAEKKLRRKKKTEKTEAEEAAPEPEPEETNYPEPKIVDASVPAPARKPTLAELKARRAGASKSDETRHGLSPLKIDDYTLPDIDLLDPPDDTNRVPANPEELREIQNIIVDTLEQFGIRVRAGDITKGPTITRYEVYPEKGVRVDRITSVERDIARATRAERINILAPIPGKDTVGIEIANRNKVKITLRELLESEDWATTKAKLPLALGKDVYGHAIIADLAQMPHCLVAGTTGSGKSVCINAIIASLVFRYSPEELRFIMIDPKVVEMQVYNKLPHLAIPVVTDPKKVLMALRWVIEEMELRYRIFAKVGVRNISSFNSRPAPKSQKELDAEKAAAVAENGDSEETVENAAAEGMNGEEEAPPEKIVVPRDADEIPIPERMPYIVVIIDELADLMQTAPADVEGAIARITQMARAAGIHMIVATQTPRADVVTGIIKANIPSRIAFQVASKIDSRVILDENGADKLLGQGDMLYLPPGTSKLTRAQGVFVTDEEIRRIVEFAGRQSEPKFEASIHERLNSATSGDEEDITEEDEELIEKCLEIIKQEKRASTSFLQRRLRLGYNRAARVVDILEKRGILGPADGSNRREILVDLDSL